MSVDQRLWEFGRVARELFDRVVTMGAEGATEEQMRAADAAILELTPQDLHAMQILICALHTRIHDEVRLRGDQIRRQGNAG